MCFGLYQPRCLNLTDFYTPSRRLQDHQRVERGDAAVTADVPARVGRAAADRNLKRDHGVRGGECWRLLWGQRTLNWLGHEWIEINFSFSFFFIIVDARIDCTAVHSRAPVVVLCFDRLVLVDVELPLPAAARCIVVAVLDDVVVTDVVARAS